MQYIPLQLSSILLSGLQILLKSTQWFKSYSRNKNCRIKKTPCIWNLHRKYMKKHNYDQCRKSLWVELFSKNRKKVCSLAPFISLEKECRALLLIRQLYSFTSATSLNKHVCLYITQLLLYTPTAKKCPKIVIFRWVEA